MRSIDKIFTLILASLVLFSFLRLSPINVGQPTSAQSTVEVSGARGWVTSALNWLKAWQNEDGGWGQRPYEQSDLLYTAWTMTAMINAGYPIESPELKRASDFLIRVSWPDYALYIILRPLLQMGEIESQRVAEAIDTLERTFRQQCQEKDLDNLSFDNYVPTLALAERVRTIQADLNWIIELQNIDGSFGETQYIGESAVEDKARHTSWALVSLFLFSAQNEARARETKAPNSYVYPESQDILLPRHGEKNVSLYVTPLKEGEINLELRLFSNDKLVGLRIMRIRAYAPPFTVLDFVYKWGPVLGLVSASISIATVAWKIYQWRQDKAGNPKKRGRRSKRDMLALNQSLSFPFIRPFNMAGFEPRFSFLFLDVVLSVLDIAI